MNLSYSSEDDIIRLEQLKALYNVVGAIASKLNLEDIFESTLSAVKVIIGSDEMCVALINKTTDGFEIDRETIRHTCSHPSHLMPRGNRQSCAQTVIETNKPNMISSSGKLIAYDQLDKNSAGDIVFAVVPLTSQNKSIGFLSVVAPENRSFNHIDMILLTILASHIAIAIENARLHMRVQELTLAKERSRIAKEILTVVMKNENIYDKLDLLTSPLNGKEKLTDKERKILTLMTKGCTNEEIAEELFLGLKTVKTHVSHILKKLGQKNRVQAIVYALKQGLIEFSID